MKVILAAFFAWSVLASAQAPEYFQICPTADCVARDQWQSRTATTGVAHETAIAGYVRNLAAGSNGVALFGLATQEGPGTAWGLNTLQQDARDRVVHFDRGRRLVGYEGDFNVMGQHSAVIGISLGGNSLAQSENANAFMVNTLGNGFRWTTGFVAMDYAAENAMFIGAATPTQSQRVLLRSGQHIQILQAEDGVLRLYSTGANGLRVEWGGVTADTFTPTSPPVLADTASPAEIVRALRAIGLVR